MAVQVSRTVHLMQRAARVHPTRPEDLITKIKDLTLSFFIGVLPEERKAPQRVVVNVWMASAHQGRHDSDDLANYVSYADVVEKTTALAAAGAHIDLVETLAEKICDFALEDPRVEKVWVSVEKPDIFEHVAGVGVELMRVRA